MTNTVKVRVVNYEEGIDAFTLSAFGFDDRDHDIDPWYCKSAPDFDDFTVPGLLMPALIGGQLDDKLPFVGQVFTITLP